MKERKREGGKESERERETHADYFLFDILTSFSMRGERRRKYL